MSDTRLVPMTREQRERLNGIIRNLEDWGGLLGNANAQCVQKIRAAWDAAPADPAEAVHEAVEAATREWAGMPWDGCGIPIEMQEGALVGMVRDAALVALGFDREPPA